MKTLELNPNNKVVHCQDRNTFMKLYRELIANKDDNFALIMDYQTIPKTFQTHPKNIFKTTQSISNMCQKQCKHILKIFTKHH